jgi:hypothetical protein
VRPTLADQFPSTVWVNPSRTFGYPQGDSVNQKNTIQVGEPGFVEAAFAGLAPYPGMASPARDEPSPAHIFCPLAGATNTLQHFATTQFSTSYAACRGCEHWSMCRELSPRQPGELPGGGA